MLEEHDEGPIRTLKLARPPVNALDEALLARLEAAVRRAPEAGVRGLIITGSGERFSAGLDVRAILKLERIGVESFWRAFFGCLGAIAACPLPVIAAINGHSPAGGAVLALYCDRRLMAEGAYRIGLNEVAVGLYPGPVIHRVLRRIVGERLAAEFLSTGAMLSPAAALAGGLVDELAPPAELHGRAKAWLERVLALPAAAYAQTRALTRADLIELGPALSGSAYAQMTDAWLAPETQATLQALFAKPAKR